MGVSTVQSAAVFGLRIELVNVEADVGNGLPAFHMVGYLSSEVKEAGERVRTAIRNSGLEFPAKKTVINLSPATIRKRGAAFDLPIAIAILTSLGTVAQKDTKGLLILGELGLDGAVHKVPGVLPVVMEAKKQGICRCMIPLENEQEARLVDGMEVTGVQNLKEAFEWIKGKKKGSLSQQKKKGMEVSKGKVYGEERECAEEKPDFQDICGQSAVKRAVEVAVAGGHNLLMVGPPGSGKTMIAKRIPTILPPLTLEESLEITKIYSIVGQIDGQEPLIRTRPFRSVHHTVTKTALTGGGLIPSPGEITLAHGGVLFLDELPEFRKPVLEVLRQPLEERKIWISRTHGTYLFPANFMLVCAMNPCPCGEFGSGNCTCTPGQVRGYLGKLSQPFLDRMDLCVEAPKVTYAALKGKMSGRKTAERKGETSAQIRQRVCAAREIQNRRFSDSGTGFNAMMSIREVEQYCKLGDKEEALIQMAYERLGLTARSYHKILKVARTIADLAGSEKIESMHLAEAIGYRSFDQKYRGGIL